MIMGFSSDICSPSKNNGGPSSVTEGNSSSDSPISQIADHLLNQTPTKKKNEKIKVLLLDLPPLGLKLKQEPYFLDLIETSLSPQERFNLQTQNNHNKVESVKKASKLDASSIRIGSWQRMAKRDEDLVAKCYFAKKKLVWEILEGALKSKIEIQWEYIIGMRVVLERNLPGILELELSQPPLFFKETDPRPRRHTLWASTHDFTNGQATICRKHSVQFPPGAFDRHFEKLITHEPRFLHMCRSPFPTQQSPYFPSYFHNMAASHISFGHSEIKPEMNSVQQQEEEQYPYSSTSAMSHFPDQVQVPLQHNQIYQTTGQPSIVFDDFSSPILVRDLPPPLDELIGNNRVENAEANEALWGQQMTNYGNLANEFQGLDSTVVTVTPENNYNPLSSLAYSEGEIYNPLPQFPSGYGNQFLTYSDFEGAANGSINRFASFTRIEENVAAPRDNLEYSSFNPFDFTAMQDPLKRLL